MITIRIGDCRHVLPDLPPASVHCVVTSPPYFGLRDYGAAGQIGLEPTPEQYVAELVEVFRQVRRVLRDDGTVWLNLGDSYAGSWSGNSMRPDGGTQRPGGPGFQPLDERVPQRNGATYGMKPKDLLGIPWRVAFALQADGWYLRQDIIWSKPNPMPESVRDRCTKAHEYLFLLSKSERYYYDADAIADPAVTAGGPAGYAGYSTRAHAMGRAPSGNEKPGAQAINADTRNKRSVWEVTTQPFPEAHFATFPPALIEPCILAGCPEKVCAKCGAPWVRDVAIESKPNAPSCAGKYDGVGKHRTVSGGVWNDARQRTDRGFSRSCSCNAVTKGGTVLDPFGGAGTTGLVADRLGRNVLLVELNPAYVTMAHDRLVDDAPLFVEAQVG